ncbi:M20/M25/M40 family metallo-hydrolase [Microbacterium profundi]|uniref:M20/M25/M40 family metallo-hydrolase n=1 Tax=Microbacterium profundi TaxID=450380 RepID=UPI001F32CC5B|nr:M20/M25/M40 family metallo-hydrolase [Microbacterium profundi]MCE7482009.1 M20/M25/M40 family metallo-hydrolase [Microbacterium profundi]
MTLTFESDDSRYIAELAEYVAIPSVSRDGDPATLRRAAEWIASRIDFADPQIVETGGHPAVVGAWLGAPGAPTVLVYGHYDVQPTGSLDEWKTPPFELTSYVDEATGEQRLRGRGSADDKGPVYLVVETCRQFLAQEGALPCNLRFLFEGEEEIGSPHLASYVRAHADELGADLVISADGAQWRPDEPSLSVASKGLLALDVTVTGANRDLHSGRYGGTVANPIHALTSLLATMHDEEGRITVDGFHDGIPALTDERLAEVDAVAFDEEAYRADLDVPALHGEPGLSTLARLWTQPTLEINGITGGGSYTVIPHTASAHITCRLVPGQHPDAVRAAIEAHVAAHTPAGVRTEIHVEGGAVPAYTIDPAHPGIQIARDALEQVYPGEEVLLAVIAGTLPATVLFEEALGAKTMFFSFALADEWHHAPNEFFRARRLREGMRAWEILLRGLGAAENLGAAALVTAGAEN